MNNELSFPTTVSIFYLQIVVGDDEVEEFLEKLFGEFGSISRGLSEAAAGL